MTATALALTVGTSRLVQSNLARHAALAVTTSRARVYVLVHSAFETMLQGGRDAFTTIPRPPMYEHRRGACRAARIGGATSAPNPKFAHIVRQVRSRTSGSKGH